MQIELPSKPEEQNWQGIVGMPRDAIVKKFLSTDWIIDLSPSKTLAVSEYWEFPFSIQFIEAPHFGMDPIRFTLAFHYKNNSDQMRLADVSLGGSRYNGWGKKLLTSTVNLALDMGLRKVVVRPGRDGSWYWPYRGAMLSEWPDNLSSEAITENARCILQDKEPQALSWQDADFLELNRVISEKDCFGLNQLLARDDLPLLRNGKSVPLRRALVQNIMLGDCSFDFDHSWTQERLLLCTGIDVEKRIAQSNSTRPEFEKSTTVRAFNYP